MAMLTPTPFMMRPNSFEHLALLHNFLRNFSGLRLTLGTVLRMTADIGSNALAGSYCGWLLAIGMITWVPPEPRRRSFIGAKLKVQSAKLEPA